MDITLGTPFFRGTGFIKERRQLPGRQFFLEGLINALLTLDASFPDELQDHDNRQKMLTIAVEFSCWRRPCRRV